MAVALRDLERGHARRRPTLRVVQSQPQAPTPTPVFWLRRVLVLAVVIAAILGTVTVVRATASTAPAPSSRIEMTVVVPTGGTLWDVARHYAPAGADRSAWVLDVAARNTIDPATIQPGTPLLIPVDGPHVLAAPQATVTR